MDPAVDLLLTDAHRANSGGHPAEARRLLERALALTDHPEPDHAELVVRARAMVSLAVPVFHTEGLAAALATLDAAVVLAGSLHESSMADLAAIQRGGLLARSGRWAEAVEALEPVTSEGPHIGPREVAVAALNRGLVRQYLGQFDQSATELALARDLAERADVHDVRSMAVHNLGCLALLRGDVPSAIRLMTEAGGAAAGTSSSSTRLDLGRAHIEGGLVDDAVQLLRSALRVAISEGLPHTRGEILVELARCAILSGDDDEAVRRAREASAIFAEHNAPNWQHLSDVIAAEASLASGDAGVEVRSQIATLEDVDTESPALRESIALLGAEAALLVGDIARAEARLADARRHRSVLLSSRLHGDLVDASVGHACGSAHRRTRALRRASDRIVRESTRYSGLDSRTALALHGRRLAELDLGTAVETGRASAVFSATERWRAISSRVADLRPSPDETLQHLATELRHVRRQLEEAAPGGADELGAHAQRLEQALRRRERELSTEDEEAGRTSGLAPAAYADVRKRLVDARAGCVAFFVHDDRLHALTTGRGGGRIVPLCPAAEAIELCQRIRADLRAAALTADQALRSVIDVSFRADVARLDSLLAPGLALPDERLVVVPSVALPSVPWRLLPCTEGRPVTVAPSATTWGMPFAPRHDRTVVSVAGPGLAGAAAEATAVAALWPGATVLSGPDASVDAFTRALRDATVAHVAAHGTHHDQSPLFSSVRLADGPVFAHEFQRAGVGAQHVVLSSCDVGRAHVRPGDEALGLTASLLDCGVRSVVAAVAPVRDEHAGAVMTAYHRLLASGVDGAAALELASRGIPDGRLFCTYGADWSVDGTGAVLS